MYSCAYIDKNWHAGEKEVAVGTILGHVSLEIVEELGEATTQQEVGHQVQSGRKKCDDSDHSQRRRPFQVVAESRNCK